LALKLAKKFNGFLISADSRQVYRGMDIGTNKDPGRWRQEKFFVSGVPEYLVDFINPDEEFGLGEWLKRVKHLLSPSFSGGEGKDKLPVIVGGTSLYTSALINNFKLPKFDKKLRAKLEKQAAEKGVDYLLKKIKKIDPNIEQKIDIKNPRRVVRAAEICLQTKKPFTKEKGESEFEFLQIGIKVDREKLYKKLDQRAERQFKQGLVKEVQTLVDQGYPCSLPSMSGIGYKQVCNYLNKEIPLAEAIELNKRDNRRYAKRQLSWFKRDKTIQWVEKYAEAEKLARPFLEK